MATKKHAKAKPEIKPKEKPRSELSDFDKNALVALEVALDADGKPATSTQIADRLKLTGGSRRDKVRRSMSGLEKAGKVKIGLGEGMKRQYVYQIVHSGA